MKKEHNIEITHSNNFQDHNLLSLFKLQTKEIDFKLEIHFDTFLFDKIPYTLIAIWYSDSLYGNSYRIMNNEIRVRYIDSLKDKKIEITENLSKEELTKIIIKDIKENSNVKI